MFPGVTVAALRIAGPGEPGNKITRIYIEHKKLFNIAEKYDALARIRNYEKCSPCSPER